MSSKQLFHLGPVALFSAGTVAWLWDVLHSPNRVIPGNSAGDNVTFVWNIWWVQHAIRSHALSFSCPYLFAPLGVDLTLHTLAVLPSTIAAILAPVGSVVAATNALVALNVLLNFVAAYGLVWRATRSLGAASLAGLFFGWSPYVAAHLQGHFNLVAAWPLPVVGVLLLETLESMAWASPVLLGLVCGLLPYVDYYDSVFAAALALALLLASVLRVERARPLRALARWQRATMMVCGAVLALDAVLGLAIWWTGGTVITTFGQQLSLRGTRNVLTIAWLLVALIITARIVPGVRIRRDSAHAPRVIRRFGLAGVIAVVLIAPLALHALRLLEIGEYVTQRYFWRSAPAGIDVSTLVLGNPYGLLTGHTVPHLYSRLNIDLIEQIGWMGPAALILWAAAWGLRRTDRRVRAWTWITIVFFVWALGPYLRVGGRNSYLMLPETALRFVPIAANARIPGRAMVVVYLGLAVLVGIGFQALRERGHRTAAAALAAMLVIDCAPAPVASFELDHPSVYDVLRSQPAGSLIELPLGLRDGFGEIGRLDSRVLWYQTIHEHPIAGGFVARLPPRIVTEYRKMPIVGSLLRLSAGSPIAEEPRITPAAASTALHQEGFEYIVTDTAAMSPSLAEYVRQLPLRQLATEAGRTLYKID